MTAVVQETKVCKTCGLEKDAEIDFGNNVKSPTGKQASCRTCMGKVMMQGRQRANDKYGHQSTEHVNRKPVAVAKRKTKPVVNYSDYTVSSNTTPLNTPMFVQVGVYDINLASVALVDRSAVSSIDVVLSVHDMNRDGHIVARVINLSGTDRDAFLASYQQAIGKPPTELLDKLTTLEHANADLVRNNTRLIAERDAAMQLAEELESKRKKLIAALS